MRLERASVAQLLTARIAEDGAEMPYTILNL